MSVSFNEFERIASAAGLSQVEAAGLSASYDKVQPLLTKPTVSGAKAANAALTSLLAALVALGLITDTTTA